MRSGRWSRRAWIPCAALAAAALAWSGGCGSGPADALPTGAAAPATIAVAAPPRLLGRYLLRVEPAPDCGLPLSAASFLVEAAPADTARSSGTEVVLAAAVDLEMELRTTAPSVEGGLGTVADGVAALEGVHAWIRAIGQGTITASSNGRAEVLAGSLRGDLAFGSAEDVAALGACSSLSHRWSLRPQ
jgi:hypothetical protein